MANSVSSLPSRSSVRVSDIRAPSEPDRRGDFLERVAAVEDHQPGYGEASPCGTDVLDLHERDDPTSPNNAVRTITSHPPMMAACHAPRQNCQAPKPFLLGSVIVGRALRLDGPDRPHGFRPFSTSAVIGDAACFCTTSVTASGGGWDAEGAGEFFDRPPPRRPPITVPAGPPIAVPIMPSRTGALGERRRQCFEDVRHGRPPGGTRRLRRGGCERG